MDSDAFWRFVREKENFDAENIIVIGYSVGGSPAARIASLHNVNVLVLISAFSSIKDVLRDQICFKLMVPLLWSALPTVDYVHCLKKTNLIVVHGKLDRLVRPHHADKIASAYRGERQVALIWDDLGTHNTAFYSKRGEIAAALVRYL